jgi:hypothetical protein
MGVLNGSKPNEPLLRKKMTPFGQNSTRKRSTGKIFAKSPRTTQVAPKATTTKANQLPVGRRKRRATREIFARGRVISRSNSYMKS